MTEIAKQRLSAIGAALSPSPISLAIADLQTTFPSTQLSLDETILTRHGTSFGSFSPPILPSIVVHAESTEDVVATVNIARKHKVVLIPVAGRTALEGQFLPPACCELAHRPLKFTEQAEEKQAAEAGPRPTIHLSVARMDQVLKVHPQDFQAVVQPGIGWQGLNEHLEEEGVPLFFPVDPAPGALFGGMVGVGGSGTNTVGYGTMRAEWIQGLEVVLMNGEVINTRGNSRARKSSTGWDVGRLFMGSEGTLGIITKLHVRLAPITPIKVGLTSFSTISSAVQAAISIVQSGLSPTSLELLDATSTRAMNLAEILPEPLPEMATLFVRFTGGIESAVDGAMEKANEIVQKNGARPLRIGKTEKESSQIWKARKSQYWSQQLLLEGCQIYGTDSCVPLSRLAEYIDRTAQLVEESGCLAPLVAHAGDGNTHRSIMFIAKPGATSAPPEVVELASKISRLAIELEGSCAGEHGIGTTKRKYLKEELGKGTLKVMRAIKETMDPEGLLNPGKVLFEREEDE